MTLGGFQTGGFSIEDYLSQNAVVFYGGLSRLSACLAKVSTRSFSG